MASANRRTRRSLLVWQAPAYAAPKRGGTPSSAATAAGGHSEEITSLEGIPALSLDAISSVAYGPEAMLVVLASAGAGTLAKTEPITVAIVVLLVILVFSYRQMIAAYPDGGGCYASPRPTSGTLIVDYVLTVAVSTAAGVAALVSAFPALGPDSLAIGLGIRAVLTLLNLRGLATSARALLVLTAVFIVGIYVVIVAGSLRRHPVAGSGIHVAVVPTAAAVGVLSILKAAGCSALTGVEAIANDVPASRQPRARRAMRAGSGIPRLSAATKRNTAQ